MKDYKKIDRLFQEKFRDFEQVPPPHVWDNISGTHTGKPKKDRRVIWLWFSGVAAGLAVLFTLNNPFFSTSAIQNNTSDAENTVINPETEITNIQENTIEVDNILNTKNTLISNTTTPQIPKNKANNKQFNTPFLTASTNTTDKSISKINQKVDQNTAFEIQQQNKLTELSKESKLAQADNKLAQSNESSLADNVNINNIAKESLITTTENKNNSDEVVSKTKSNKKWILSTIAAPVMMGAFDKGVSSIDAQFNNNDKQGQISASFGVQLAYQVNDRFFVQSGLHKVDYGYKTNNVFVSPDNYASVYANIDYDDSINLIEINPSPTSDSDQENEENGIKESEGNLMQILGYYEIPLEAKYTIKEGDFGINVLGGFSTLILNKNEIYVQTADFSNKIGEATNLNKLNLTGNIGIEFDYKIYQNIHINVSPMIKVHTHTFENNTGGFSPYTIGVYSGLNFRF